MTMSRIVKTVFAVIEDARKKQRESVTFLGEIVTAP